MQPLTSGGAVVALLLATAAPLLAAPATGTGDGSGPAAAKAAAASVRRVASQVELGRMETFLEANRVREGLVKSIRTAEGDQVDCVTAAVQPALKQAGKARLSLLTAPRTAPALKQAPAAKAAANPGEPARQLYLAGDTCPDKTVPIRHLSIDDLARFRTLGEFLHKDPVGIRPALPKGVQPPLKGSTALHQYAHMYRFVANWGGESVLNIWSPYTESSSEFSLSQIWVVRGSGANLETVETGIQKYKDLYGDWQSRLFIYFTPDNYGSGGCYNLSCGKFVQTDSSVYIGGAFSEYSTLDGPQKVVKLLWYKDSPTGAWWLRYADKWVGYYPRALFDANGLQSQAAEVDFGGEIINNEPGGRHTRTDMGSGRWPSEGFGKAAYQRSIRYVDTNNVYQQVTSGTTSVTDPDCYNIKKGSSTGAWEQYFYFGGSGYNTQCE